MPSLTQKIGAQGEDMALKFLLQQGYRFLDRNFRTRFGELDLVLMDGNEIVFAEVKKRASTAFGYPEEMVNWKKKRNLRKTAHIYLDRKRLDEFFYRFDTIAISGEAPYYDIRHFKDTIRVDS
jgi:putative endonuclease